MIKILHVINTLAPAGAQTLLMNFAANFNDPEYKIFIAYIYGAGELLKEYRFNENVQIFDLTRNGRFRYSSFFELIKIIKTEKIDIVHTHLIHAGILGKLAAKVCRVKHIVTTRHYGFHHDENKLLSKIEDWLLKSSSAVIAISNAVRKHLVEKNIITNDKIVVIPNAIDVKNIKLTNREPDDNKANGALTIGSVGRLDPQKDFITLLNGFKIVVEKRPNIHLEIIGDGILRHELENYVKKMKLEKSVTFKGTLPHHSVLERMVEWDLFILSSAWEGFGIALIEAMALEKAVVATTVEGITEVVDNGINGYLAPAKSPDALAEKVIELLGNEEKRIAMGKKGREKVIDQFSIEKLIEKTKLVYNNLLRSRGRV